MGKESGPEAERSLRGETGDGNAAKENNPYAYEVRMSEI